MASLCFGGPRVPLTGHGPKLMWGLRILNTALLINSIIAIIGTRYVEGSLFILFSLLFFIPLRTTHTAGTDVMCILFTTAFQAVFSLIYFILQLAGVDIYRLPAIEWKKKCLLASVYAAPWIYICMAVGSYLVFRNVRKSMYGPNAGQSSPQQSSHGRGGFGYDADRNDDVEAGRPLKKDKKQEKPANDWKKGGGRKLG